MTELEKTNYLREFMQDARPKNIMCKMDLNERSKLKVYDFVQLSRAQIVEKQKTDTTGFQRYAIIIRISNFAIDNTEFDVLLFAKGKLAKAILSIIKRSYATIAIVIDAGCIIAKPSVEYPNVTEALIDLQIKTA